jgi:hypothetical protein
MADFPAPAQLSETELAARKRRNLWIALGLVVLIGLIFAITIVHLGGDVASREH